MKQIKYLLLLLIAIGNINNSLAVSAVSATLYSGPSQTGSSFLTQDYIGDLEDFGWTESATSICVTGLWLLYERDQYNDGAIGENVVMNGDNKCMEIPQTVSGKVVSLRQVGSPIVPTRPSLTLYGYTYYEGAELYITRNMSNLGLFSDQAYSGIVTGSEPWTVYTYTGFGGSGRCLYPNETIVIGGENVGVGFFPTYKELGSSGLIRSVSRGCST